MIDYINKNKVFSFKAKSTELTIPETLAQIKRKREKGFKNLDEMGDIFTSMSKKEENPDKKTHLLELFDMAKELKKLWGMTHNPFMQIKETTSPDGKHPWYYVHRPNCTDTVLVAPIIHQEGKDDEILFLENKRPPLIAEDIAEYCIELPAGLVGDDPKRTNETPLEAAHAELMEEAGYKASKMTQAGSKVSSSAGLTSETATCFIADITDTTQHLDKMVTDSGVLVNKHRVKVKDIPKFIDEQQKQGKAIAMQTLSTLYYLLASEMSKQSA